MDICSEVLDYHMSYDTYPLIEAIQYARDTIYIKIGQSMQNEWKQILKNEKKKKKKKEREKKTENQYILYFPDAHSYNDQFSMATISS